MDFYIEYYNIIDEVFLEFMDELQNKKPEWLYIDGHSIQEIIISQLYMYSLSAQWKDFYNSSRLSGAIKNELKDKLFKDLENKYGMNGIIPIYNKSLDVDILELKKILIPYTNQIVFYLFNFRQLTILLELIRKITEPVILMLDFEIQDDYEGLLPETVTLLEISFFKSQRFYNPYLMEYFPSIGYYFNSFYFFIKYLSPKCVLFLEGCHPQAKCMNVVAKLLDIPTICIQQGWPSFFHTLYRRMEYDYYLTWGELFNNLWKKYNPRPSYKEVGYINKVNLLDKNNKVNITFFLQSPVFISDENYFSELLDLIEETALQFPEQTILVREHPEYKIHGNIINRYKKNKNISFVNDKSLIKVYDETSITVSHFSTTSMEGVIHNCIPIVFDPTTDSCYYPNFDELGIGFCVKNKSDFIKKTMMIIKENKKSELRNNIANLRKKICFDIHDDAIKNIICFINEINKSNIC